MPSICPTVLGLIGILMLASAQRPVLEARFIGNMAFAISDGKTTLMSDFPYESGFSVYMEYPATEIRSATPATLSLITHRHPDHWAPALFAKTGWSVAGPADVVKDAPSQRVVTFAPGATFGPLQIEARQTPHDNVGHYSYVVSWHGRRLYFIGDTESIESLLAVKDLDVAFLSPWALRALARAGRMADAKRIVVYHHAAREDVPECTRTCTLPKQGDVIRIE